MDFQGVNTESGTPQQNLFFIRHCVGSLRYKNERLDFPNESYLLKPHASSGQNGPGEQLPATCAAS
jgi:hypothetical protein